MTHCANSPAHTVVQRLLLVVYVALCWSWVDKMACIVRSSEVACICCQLLRKHNVCLAHVYTSQVTWPVTPMSPWMIAPSNSRAAHCHKTFKQNSSLDRYDSSSSGICWWWDPDSGEEGLTAAIGTSTGLVHLGGPSGHSKLTLSWGSRLA